MPASVTTTDGAVVALISVIVPGGSANSLTVPVTLTRCPSATGVGQLPQKMKMPSEVLGSASASASSSWRKKPLSLFAPWKLAVTTPSTVTVLPAIGEVAPFPCTSWILVMSSLTIVPSPWPSVTMALVTLVTLTKKVSSVSGVTSPLTSTSKV